MLMTRNYDSPRRASGPGCLISGSELLDLREGANAQSCKTNLLVGYLASLLLFYAYSLGSSSNFS